MTPLIVKNTIISDATTWRVTYNCHSDQILKCRVQCHKPLYARNLQMFVIS
jgi:hypothetical protein